MVVLRGLVFSVLALALPTGCPPAPEPRCGDGTVDDGEDAESCCRDVGCEFGTCDVDENVCVGPWVESCTSDVGSCFLDGPLRCQGDAPPVSDCRGCGCSDGAACVEDTCLLATVRNAARSDDELDERQALPVLTSLVQALAAAERVALADVAARITARVREDPRRAALLLAVDGAAAFPLARDVVDALGVAVDSRLVEGDSGVTDFGAALDAGAADDNRAACAAVVDAVGDRLADAGLVVAALSAPRVHEVTCFSPGSYAVCAPPLVSHCLRGASRDADTLLVLDVEVLLDRLDEVLLRAAGRATPGSVETELSRNAGAFAEAVGALQAVPLTETAVGPAAALRFAAYDDLHVVARFAPDAVPRRLLAFRVVWSSAANQAFLVDNDIQAGDCTFATAAAQTTVVCANGAARLTAVVDDATLTLVSSVREDAP